MNKSKAIGTRSETAVVRYLLERGIHAHRPALAGKADVGDAWIEHRGLLIVAEVKSRKSHATAAQVEAWMGELERECMHVPAADLGVLIVKRPGSGPANAGDWSAHMRLDELAALVGAVVPVEIGHPTITLTLATFADILAGAGR